MAQTLAQTVKKLPYLAHTKKKTNAKDAIGTLTFLSATETWPDVVLKKLSRKQKEKLKKGASVLSVDHDHGPHWYIAAKVMEQRNHYGYFAPTPYTVAQDLIATVFRKALSQNLPQLAVNYIGKNEDEFLGLLVGIEMVSYKFPQLWPKAKEVLPGLTISSDFKKQKDLVKKASALGSATNLGRLLVDMPGNALNPKTYAKLAVEHFKGVKGFKISVWDAARLKKENMGLHLAVGQASEHPSCMVHLEYRAPGCKDKPLAFVGKGITFDSGGLDVKPGSGMRLMKKDMGGSATVMGLAHWVGQAQPKINCDFYLAIAENAIGDNAFRPGDILTAKNGKTVEIHNTDAEGRLVLADTMTVAVRKKPKMLIDVATLTGAVKVGLGGATPGLFSNDDALAELVLASAQKRGETAWRMPLVPSERSRLRSDVADMVNCTDGYGGAITAALFLEAFVESTPWVHLDIYGWVPKASGVYRHTGGSGQMVQALAHFLETQVKK